jgi:hypothetical protein
MSRLDQCRADFESSLSELVTLFDAFVHLAEDDPPTWLSSSWVHVSRVDEKAQAFLEELHRVRART